MDVMSCGGCAFSPNRFEAVFYVIVSKAFLVFGVLRSVNDVLFCVCEFVVEFLNCLSCSNCPACSALFLF